MDFLSSPGFLLACCINHVENDGFLEPFQICIQLIDLAKVSPLDYSLWIWRIYEFDGTRLRIMGATQQGNQPSQLHQHLGCSAFGACSSWKYNHFPESWFKEVPVLAQSLKLIPQKPHYSGSLCCAWWLLPSTATSWLNIPKGHF